MHGRWAKESKLPIAISVCQYWVASGTGWIPLLSPSQLGKDPTPPWPRLRTRKWMGVMGRCTLCSLGSLFRNCSRENVIACMCSQISANSLTNELIPFPPADDSCVGGGREGGYSSANLKFSINMYIKIGAIVTAAPEEHDQMWLMFSSL